MKLIQLARETKQEIEDVLFETSELENISSDIFIETQSDFDSIVQIIQDYKYRKEILENEKNDFFKLLKPLQKKVNSWFNPPIKALDNSIFILREKIIEYEQWNLKQKTKAFKQGRKPKEKIQNGSVSYREQWDFEIKDFDKIPREYLALDQSKVKIELREQGSNLKIKGIRFFKIKIPVISK